MKSLKLMALATLFSTGLHAQDRVKGFVYHDVNNNGRRDGKETGISKVAVSNGVQVTLTDEKGWYELPVGKDNGIFVIKPRGYKVPLNRDNLPKFYYLHKPQGSPATLEFKGVKPTGPLPESVDFALLPQQETDDYTALIFGDPQPYTARELEFFEKGIIREVAGIKGVAFGLSLGDLVGNDLNLHQPYIKAVKKIGLPWYNLIGNHDMNFDVKTDSLSDETYEANFGPANYAFNYGKVHYIILDDVLYPNPRSGKGYLGGFRKDQLDFVENDLKFVDKDKLVVLAFHIPLEHRNGDTFRSEDRQRLFDLLKDFPNTLSLSAHMHTQSQIFYGTAEGWRQEQPHHEYNAGTTSGDWYSGQLNEQGVPAATMRDGTPKGYAFIHFKGSQYVIDYKVAGKDKSYQIEVFHPKVVGHGKNTRAGIYANFFMGHQTNLVECRIDDGKWQKMTPVSAADPAYLAELHPWDTSEELLAGRRPTNATDSPHLWRTAIATDLPIGTHSIEVRAKDRYGRIHTQKSTYRIEKAKEL
ncbi:hypothetical protein ABIE26_002082 [Pedobacter africanus]|uniref:Uncharacterized protein n=1 Tax=Pedobacter africanus TaxID=151894 RepID=A0ACC6KZE5_9SPHI|nr:calcineurin-like phosphoesterase family protein [Pedobacter africanus]MDR6784530.1 hypothetical protein [Pedobacter africanus]